MHGKVLNDMVEIYVEPSIKKLQAVLASLYAYEDDTLNPDHADDAVKGDLIILRGVVEDLKGFLIKIEAIEEQEAKKEG